MKRNGSILIVTLWFFCFLSLLALVLCGLIETRVNIAKFLMRRTQGYYLARAGVYRSLAQIGLDTNKGADALADGWMNDPEDFRHVLLGDAGWFQVIQPVTDQKSDVYGASEEPQVIYGLADEERKININLAKKETLIKFFEIIGELEPDRSSELTAAILDWRDPDENTEIGGAESDHYQSESGYSSKNASFQVLEELLLVKGMDEALFERVRNHLTIFGLGAVNINTCDVSVMRVLGAGESLAGKIVHYRAGPDGEEGTADDKVFDDISLLKAQLSKSESLNINEMQELSAMVGSGKLTVRSDNFGGISEGYLTGDSIKTSIAFVFNRNQKIKFLREG